MTRWFPSPRKTVVICRRAQLDTTTMPLVDSLSPRRRSGERVRERGFQLANSMERAPLPRPPPPPAPPGEGRGGLPHGGGIHMRPPGRRLLNRPFTKTNFL